MANECYFEMRVKGKTTDVDNFIKTMVTDKASKRFRGIYTADVYDEQSDGRHKTADICGDCAWSVNSCMIDPGARKNTGITTLKNQSRLLRLEIEVYGSEPGMGFQEHYLYQNGMEMQYKAVDYHELYFADEKEFNSSMEAGEIEGYTWDDVDEGGYIKTGGFSIWEFQI